MKKFFTKIAGVALGLAMAIGVGVAVGASNNRIVRVDAAYADSTRACYFSGTGNANSGYTKTVTLGKAQSGYYQDKSGSEGMNIKIQKNSSGVIWSTMPAEIYVKATVGGGSTKDPLVNNMLAYLIDSSGNDIAGSETIVTTKVTSQTGSDFVVSMPLKNNVAGVRIAHEKESSYNIRLYYLELSYVVASKYTVTYNANGATSGTVPTDSNEYDKDDTVTIKANTGSLEKTNYNFNGWNTKDDGTGTHYAATGSATFTITANTTLYAEWAPKLPYITVASTLEGYSEYSSTLNFTYGNLTSSPETINVSSSDTSRVTTSNLAYSAGTGSVKVNFVAATLAETPVVLSFKDGSTELATCNVTVNASSISISLDKSTATLWGGNTLTIVPTVTAVGYSDSVTWSTSNADIATVAAGVVTPVSAGVVTITCTSVDHPAEYKTCTVTVKFVPTTYYDLDLSTDKTTSASESALTWSRTYVGVSVNKSSSGTNANNYYPGSGQSSTRFYKNSVLTITNTDRCSVIDFTATTNGYASALASSTWANATASASGSSVRVLVTDSTANVTCTIGNTCGFTNIRFYCEKSWSEDFKDTFTCTGVVEGHLNGDISVANPSTVWSNFSTSFGELKSDIRDTLKTVSANESGDADAQAAARYDIVVRKYSTSTYADFIGRFSNGGANYAARDIFGITNNDSNSGTIVFIIVSMTGILAIGGYFLIKRRKEQ